MTPSKRIVIRVEYWRGTLQLTGKARTYRGAMRIAARNQNAWSPRFYAENRQLFDDGNGLAYADELDRGCTVYAV